MRKIKGLRWYMIALVTLGTVLGYLTRNTVCWRIRGLKSRRQKPGLFYRRSIAARIALRTGDIWLASFTPAIPVSLGLPRS